MEYLRFGNRYFICLTPLYVLGLAITFSQVARSIMGTSRATVVARSLTTLFVAWNLAFIFQWGTHMVPARGPISWKQMVRNQFVVVPRLATSDFAAYFRNRSGLMRHIEKEDVHQLELRQGAANSEVTTGLTGQTFQVEQPALRIVPPRGWMNVDFRELWEGRELLYFFVWRDIKVRYKQTAIGAAWAVIQPFMTMVVFSLFFGKLAKMDSHGLPYPIFYYSALLPWMYFASAVQNATNVVVEQQQVITKVYFPRLVLPLSAVVSGLLDFSISFVVFLGMMAYFRIVPSPAILLFPFFLLLAVMTALGVGLWLSALNAIYRDVRYVIPFLVQFWLFASPVAYPSSLVPERWRWLYGLNPMAGVIEGFRWALTGHGQPPNIMLAISFGMVVLLVASGLAFFHRMEGTIADVV